MARTTGSESQKPKLTIRDFKTPGTRDIELVPWPGKDRDVGLMHLNCQELLDAHAAAREVFRKLGIPADMWSMDALEKEEMIQQLAIMLVDPEDRTGESKLCKSAGEVRQNLSYVERAWFAAQHDLLFGEKAQGIDFESLLQQAEE